jgi:hypothetical protein
MAHKHSEEAALRLRWPVGTVKSRLVRGRRRLEARLTRRGLAPVIALAAAIGTECSAAVPLVLAVATTRIAVAGAQATIAATISASVDMLLKKESSAMWFAKLKLVAGGIVAAGAAVVLIGVALAGPLGRRAPEIEPQAAGAQGPAAQAPIAANPKRDRPQGLSVSAKLSARGRVVGADGRPVAGANVTIREWATRRTLGMRRTERENLFRGQEIPDILAHSTTDVKGEFHFADVVAPAFTDTATKSVGKNFFPWDVVAYATGHGLAWVQLTARNQRTEITLSLPAEGTLRGRLVEPGGKPIVGARVKVSGIDPLGQVDVSGLETDGQLNLLWSEIPLVAISGDDGRFALRGLPRAIVASLIITDPRHERTVVHAATTDQAQPEITHTTNIQGQAVTEKKPIYSGDFSITLKPTDHRLAGRVFFAATGKPAVGAQVSLRQRRVAEADADGKFVVENLPAGEAELHIIAWKTDAGPLDMRLMIPEEPKSIEQDFALPAGLIVTGRVIDLEAGSGIADAELIYRPRPEPGRLPSIFGFTTKTEPDGRFRLVVPAGQGGLEVWKLPPSYVNPLSHATGPNRNPRLKLDFSGNPGETVRDLTFRLGRAKTFTLMVRDPEGKPVAGAEVHRRGLLRQDETPTTTDAAGRGDLSGVDSQKGATVDVIHPTEPLGARVVIRPDEPVAGGAGRTLEVKLERTASLIGRVLDEEGKPVVESDVLLYSDIQYPSRLGTSVATVTEVRNDGTFSFDRLIAGVSYYVQISATNHATLIGEHIRAKAGEIARPKEFRLPAADQELRGVVVDQRGQPVVGATVGFQRTDGRQLMAPRPGRWFQQTDDQGRFHLTALPRGPLTLTAYRKPEGADRSIRNMVRVEAKAGDNGNEVRIVLPDANDRLRGIE